MNGWSREMWVQDFREHADRDPMVRNLKRLRTAITTTWRKP